jgi:diguanylate cyclase (GGDEF)-like protein
MTDFVQAALEAARKMWHIYLLDRTEAGFQWIFSHLAPDFVMIGTGKHEYYTSAEAVIAGVQRDAQSLPDAQFEIVDEWYAAQPISDELCQVYGTFWAREKATEQRRMIADMDTRFTLLCRKAQGEVQFVNLHHSIPSVDQQNGEFYPKTLTERANELLQRYETLAWKLQRDVLTSLYNREHAQRQVEEYFQRGDRCGAVLMLDIDDFKAINDSLGHLQGDAVLRDFARLLERSFGREDMVARMGGDEFLVLLPGASQRAGIAARAEQVIRDFGNHLAGLGLPAGQSCSVGGAMAPMDGQDFTALYGKADRALYAAKAAGKARFRFYTGDGAPA